MSSLPTVPPRPSKASATSPPPESSAPAPPSIPARPARSRSKSPLPKSGAEGDAVPEVHFEEAPSGETSSSRPSSPETKRKIDPNLDLHQPMAVRPAGETGKTADDIPEIGQRVPMLDFAGDVQAPSPLPPDSRSASRAKRRSQHNPSLPPGGGPMVVGDYGAYPSGNVYRQNGTYSLSHDDLIKSVMTAKGAGVATTPGLEGVPDEEIGYMASDEIASRNATPQATPGGVMSETKLPTKSPLSTAVSIIESENDATHQLPNLDEAGNDSHGIYGKSMTNASSTSLGLPTSGRQTPWEEFQDERQEGTPILASDEAGKYPVWNPPAISPRLSAQEVRRPPSSNRSRQSPSMLPEEDISEPPSPIKEHVPLFPEAAAAKLPARPKLGENKQSKSFPSKDIWEDAPESIHVTYEVQGDEEKEDPDYYDPRAKKLAEAAATESLDAKDSSAAAPPLPTHRPAKRVPTDESSPISPDSKTAPVVPERPKPSIPPRPTKKAGDTTTEGSSSPEEARSPPITKPKPMVPPKVGGGIAALRANFMSDLNSRLSKGPVAPKKEEPAPEAEAEPKEPEPLEDVRKTRTRGPAKRKPTAASGATDAPSGPKLTFSSIITVYSIGDDYEVSFDETKFDDEPSKIARPIEQKILGGTKGGEDVNTAKQVTAVEPPAVVTESEDAPKEETATTGPIDTITDDAAKSVTEELKPEPTEERAVVA